MLSCRITLCTLCNTSTLIYIYSYSFIEIIYMPFTRIQTANWSSHYHKLTCWIKLGIFLVSVRFDCPLGMGHCTSLCPQRLTVFLKGKNPPVISTVTEPPVTTSAALKANTKLLAVCNYVYIYIPSEVISIM